MTSESSSRRDSCSELQPTLDAIAALVVATDCAGIVTAFNVVAQRLLGWTAEEVVGRNVAVVLPLTDRPSWLAAALVDAATSVTNTGDMSVPGRSSDPRPCEFVHKDGTVVPVRIAVNAVRDSQRQICGYAITGWLCQPEERSGMNSAALPTRAPAAPSSDGDGLTTARQLAAGLAHDLNNTLLLISFCSEHLLAQLRLDDPNRNHVSAMIDATDRGAELTAQLAAFSQQQRVELKTVDLNDLIARSEQRIRTACSPIVNVSFNLSTEPLPIHVDPDLMDRFVLNLVIHARDAMPAGGRLTFHTDRMADTGACNSMDGEPRIVRLRVSDTGAGMTEAVAARVLEPYFVTNELAKGPGLGLAVVNSIASRFGGAVRVESRPGTGTTFEIRFPMAASATVGTPTASNVDPGKSSKIMVLLVEDDARLRQLLKTSLESQACRVLEASHGPGAIAAAVRYAGPIHLLLTDVELPEMSGYEIAQALRESFPGLPAIYISGSGRGEGVAASAADRFIQKPFRTSELLRQVRDILSDSNK